MTDRDSLGDRMKGYEAAETERVFMPMLPIYARIDGRCFSAFTRGLDRLYDGRISAAMVETAKHLAEATHARIGYTQSDEISLVWQADNPKGEAFFAGKIQKVVSILGGGKAASPKPCRSLDNPPSIEHRGGMDETDRKLVYETLLRGLANEAQDRLCAADKQHAWGAWRRFQVQHDDVPLRFDPSPVVTDMRVLVRAERKCLNCGKEQTSRT